MAEGEFHGFGYNLSFYINKLNWERSQDLRIQFEIGAEIFSFKFEKRGQFTHSFLYI